MPKAKSSVAAELTNQAADAPHLLPLIEQVEENLSQRPREVSADAGYFSEANIMELGHVGVEAFIPPDKVKHSQWREAQAPKGRIPKNATVRERMRRKLKTKRGRARYKLRQTTVEPVFGQIKQGRGLRQFLLRGLEKVRSSWRFDCAVHNLIKLFRAGVWVRPEGVRA
ncbi:MAG: transposase [Moorella sp. (in: Bacteria)]|nr:transposase [Moorella sp. (in: firmicutes)]